jgi:hypothetical protein
MWKADDLLVLNDDDVADLVRAAVKLEGSKAAFAKRHGVDRGLGLRCLFVEYPEGTERLKSRVPPRNGSYVRGGGTHVVLTFRFMQKIGRLGAQARIDNSTKEQRQEWGAMRRSRVGAKSTHEARPVPRPACFYSPRFCFSPSATIKWAI